MSESRPPTVLVLVRTLQIGGSERLAADLAAGVLRRGAFRPVVCAWRRGGPIEKALAGAGVATRVLNLPRRKWLAGPLMAWDICRVARVLEAVATQERAVAIHCRLPDGPLLAWGAARRLKIPVIAHAESDRLTPEHVRPGSLPHWLWRKLLRWSLRRVERVIAVSPMVRAALMNELGVEPGRITTILNSVPLPPASSEGDRAASRRDLRKCLGIGADDPILVCVGRLVENKGQCRLIEMMPALLRRRPKAHLLLVGDGPSRDNLETLAARTCPAGSVHFLGETDRVGEALDASDLFITASQYEGTSLALLEAMARGLSVISLANAGNREVLAEESGLLVPEGDPAGVATGLAEAAECLLAEPGRARRLADRGRDRVHRHYSQDATLAQLETVYHEVLRRRAARRA